MCEDGLFYESYPPNNAQLLKNDLGTSTGDGHESRPKMKPERDFIS